MNKKPGHKADGRHNQSALQAIRPAALLHEELPGDWTPDEKLLFSNWLRQVVKLHETLTGTAPDRPRLLWRAAKIYEKLKSSIRQSRAHSREQDPSVDE